MRRRLLLSGGLTLGVGRLSMASPPGLRCAAELRLPVGSRQADQRNEFSLQLLAAALEAAGCASTLDVRGDFNQPDGLRALREGRLDVGVAASVLDPSAGVRFVHEPIRRGLLGLRLLVCKVSRAAEMASLRSLAELRRRCVIGYGADWSDLGEYRRLGLRVATSDSYAGLFELLHSGQVDLLSRGVNEVWDEVDSGEHGRGELMAVPRIGLSYPLDDYFVVRPDAPELQAAIGEGLLALQRDGRYRALFEQHFRLAIRRSELAHRQLFPLTGYRPDTRVAEAQALLLKGIRTPA
jgi:hypothetical protein